MYPWIAPISLDIDVSPVTVTQIAVVTQTAVAFDGSAINAAATSLSSNIIK